MQKQIEAVFPPPKSWDELEDRYELYLDFVDLYAEYYAEDAADADNARRRADDVSRLREQIIKRRKRTSSPIRAPENIKRVKGISRKHESFEMGRCATEDILGLSEAWNGEAAEQQVEGVAALTR